jgi:hypothetical protein
VFHGLRGILQSFLVFLEGGEISNEDLVFIFQAVVLVLEGHYFML